MISDITNNKSNNENITIFAITKQDLPISSPYTNITVVILNKL